MIEEVALVEKISGDKMDLRITQPEQCDACAIRESCYGRGNVVTVPREPGVEVNDSVELEISHTSILGLSALIYGVPLAGLLAGVLAGYYGLFAGLAETGKTLASVGSGIALLGLCALVVRFAGRRISDRIEYRTRRIFGQTEQFDAASRVRQ